MQRTERITKQTTILEIVQKGPLQKKLALAYLHRWSEQRKLDQMTIAEKCAYLGIE